MRTCCISPAEFPNLFTRKIGEELSTISDMSLDFDIRMFVIGEQL